MVILPGAMLVLVGSWLVARRRHEPWRDFVRRTADLHALTFVLVAALAVQFRDTHGVTTDGVIYFTHLRSAIFDRDLDVAAEFAYLQQPPRPSHVVPIGPTLVWLPLYLATAAIDAIGRAAGLWAAPADDSGLGLTLPYVRAALVSSFLIGALGLVAMHLRLRREFGGAIALAGTLLLFLATPLVWYMVYEPAMTHAASFGLVTLFVLASERHASPDMPRRSSLLLGGLLGLAFMTRPQEAVFALFPATFVLMASTAWTSRLQGAARLAGWAFVGALPALMLQAVHGWLLLSRERFALAGDGGYLDPLRSRWADTLWSSWHGFFAWTPVAYIAFIALIFYVARNRRWATAALVIVLVMAWVNGSTTDWAGGWSFGGRRFTSVLAVLAPGVALVVHGLARRPLVSLSLLGALLVVWQQLLITQYASGALPAGTAVSFGQIVRQQAGEATHPPFIYPFAFPANAWFAWRTGLPAERYDLLGPETLAPRFALEMNDGSGKYLLEGWGARGADPFGELRWLDGVRAGLVVPFDPAAGGAELTLRARTRLLDPPEAVTLAVLVNGVEVGRVTPNASVPTAMTFEVSEATLFRGFNRVELERRSGSAPVAIYGIAVDAGGVGR